MNILKLQDQLKGLPDQTLTGYVQNPTGEVPTYLALSELQRRKTMRDKYQQQQAPQTTVAEDLAAPPQPQGLAALPQGGQPMPAAPAPEQAPQGMAQGGVADLDTGDMYNEANYATGGIVAFDDGGSIWDKARNYLLPPSPTTMKSLQGQSSNPFMGYLTGADSDPTVLLYKLKELNAKPSKTLDDWEQIKTIEQQIKGGDQRGGYTPQVKPAKTDAQVNVDNMINNKPPVPGDGGIASTLPKEMTLDEAIAQQKAAYEKMGVNKDFYAEQAKLNEEERKALDKDKSQAGWMALARAGLGMAGGKSRYALQNIAEGAAQGLEQYGKDTKDLRAEMRLSKAADKKLAEAQYLQSRGDAEGALKAMREHEKLLLNAQQHRDTINATIQAAKIGASSRAGVDEDTIVRGFKDAVASGEYKNTKADFDRYRSLFTTGPAAATAGWGNLTVSSPN